MPNICSTPLARYNKINWYKDHNRHKYLANTSKPELVLIGDSIIANLSRYNNIWRKHFDPLVTVNFGISGDRTQHILWRANDIKLSDKTKYVVIHCGTNNVDSNQPADIADGIINVGLAFKKTHPNIKIIVTGLLPRDLAVSSFRRSRISNVNKALQKKCEILPNCFYMKQDDDWILEGGELNKQLFYKDSLHLIEAGCDKLSSSICKFLKNVKGSVSCSSSVYVPRPVKCARPLFHSYHSTISSYITPPPTPHVRHPFIPHPVSHSVRLPNSTLTNDFAIGQAECLGRGWDGPETVPLSFDIRPDELPPQSSTYSLSHSDFPLLPPPLIPPTVTRPVYVSSYVNVSKPVRPCPVFIPPVSVTRPVSCNVRSRPCLMSNHTQPMKRLNKVKPPRYEKCDYVLPPSPVPSVSVPRPVPRPVIHRQHRRRNRRHRARSVSHPVKCNTNPPITPEVEQNIEPPPNKFYMLLFLNFVNILYNLLHTPFFERFFSVFIFFLSSDFFWLFIKCMYIFFYFLIKFLKYFCKYLLYLIFAYITIITLTEARVDVNAANDNFNYNVSNFIDFNNYDEHLFFKPNIYDTLYLHKYQRDFITVSKMPPSQGNELKENDGTSLWIISSLLFLF